MKNSNGEKNASEMRFEESSLLNIIDKGKEVGKEPYEALKEAGYIKNPMDEFYSNSEEVESKNKPNLSKEQIESLAKIKNSNLDNYRKIFLIREVFEGKIISFVDAEGEEYKTISSVTEGTTLKIKEE